MIAAPPALPAPTPDLLATLARMLAERGVELRVSPGGELQLRDPDRRLSPADRATVRHYADPLADWLSASHREPAADPIPAHACVACGEADPDRHAYQTDRAGDLIVVCVPCGAAWTFHDGQPITPRDRVFYGHGRHRGGGGVCF